MYASLRAFFHWQYSQLVISLLGGAGLALMLANQFEAAYLSFSLTGLWALIYWQVSDFLANKTQRLDKAFERSRRKPKSQRAFSEFRHARHSFWVSNVFGTLIVIFVTTGLIFWTHSVQTKHELEQYGGFLSPAAEADPPSFCSESARDSLKVFIGRNEAFASHFPFVVLRVRGNDRIVIDRDSTGNIALSADILDAAGRTLVTFEHGRFTVLQTNILDMRRPDRSTLIVRDQFKNEVLNVRYLNKQSLRFSGLLRYPGMGAIKIPETTSVTGICAGNAGVAYDIE